MWVYEDTDEQWKEFIPGLQVMLEEDYCMGCDSSTWRGSKHDRRQHIVNFKTQPMTYTVKCGDTIKLNTVVERRVMHGEYLCS